MYIHEVAKKALETGKRITRRDPNGGLYPRYELELNTPGSNGTITIHTPAVGKFAYCWHPSADELIADNWELVE